MELKNAEKDISELSSLYEQLRNNLRLIFVQVDSKDVEVSQLESATVIPPSLEEMLSQSSSISNTNSNSTDEAIIKNTADSRWIAPPWSEIAKDQLRQSIIVIVQLSTKLRSMKDQIDRFEKRLTEIDTVTGNPRYGEKTRQRVEIILQKYQVLDKAVSTLRERTDDNQQNIPTEIILNNIIQQKEEDEAIQEKQLEEEREQNRLLQKKNEELAEKERQQEEISKAMLKEKERQRLAELAEKNRLARLEKELQRQEEEYRKKEEERQADINFENSIEKGLTGMKQQLCLLRTLPKEDYKICLNSLKTLFTQILSKPEEVKHRKIRRDHERFLQDIGRHVGGKEFLIAAGFQLSIDENEIPCFISKEPDIENDMDGWSVWYDNLKLAVDVLEQEIQENTGK